jgi:excisionase family DNA binding protein
MVGYLEQEVAMSDKAPLSKPFDERRAFRINKAVAAYRLSRTTLYKLIAAGKLRTAKIGGRRLIPRDALEALLNDNAR